MLSNRILLKSLQTMLIQLLSQACAFVTAILLARHLEVNDYGDYIFGVTIATIIAVIATMGSGGILSRTWGKSDLIGYDRNKETFLVHNFYFKRGFVFIIIIIAVIIIYNHYKNNDNYIINYTLLLAIPFFMANILQSFFIAKRFVVFANLLQFILRIIILITILFFIFLDIVNLTILVSCIMILMTLYMTKIYFSQAFKYSLKSLKPTGSNLSFALMQFGLLLLSQIDILIIKGLSTPSEVALYGVGLQLCSLVSFVLNAVNANVLSKIADDYKNCFREEFQIKITNYTRIIFILSIFFIIGVIIFGYPITLLYGDEYIVSYFIFCILMFGQIVNILSGCVATILNMAGFERTTCFAFYIALLINIIFGIIFTIYSGIYGLAIASSVAMIYWNLHLLYAVFTNVKVNPTIFILK